MTRTPTPSNDPNTAAREGARQADGKFGTYSLPKAQRRNLRMEEVPEWSLRAEINELERRWRDEPDTDGVFNGLIAAFAERSLITQDADPATAPHRRLAEGLAALRVEMADPDADPDDTAEEVIYRIQDFLNDERHRIGHEPLDRTAARTPKCFACDHRHDPASDGRCWEAACAPDCTEGPNCPLPYTPDEPQGTTADESDPATVDAERGRGLLSGIDSQDTMTHALWSMKDNGPERAEKDLRDMAAGARTPHEVAVVERLLGALQNDLTPTGKKALAAAVSKRRDEVDESTKAPFGLTPGGHPKPINWDEMGSSEKDRYEERMDRAAAKRKP